MYSRSEQISSRIVLVEIFVESKYSTYINPKVIDYVFFQLSLRLLYLANKIFSIFENKMFIKTGYVRASKPNFRKYAPTLSLGKRCECSFRT